MVDVTLEHPDGHAQRFRRLDAKWTQRDAEQWERDLSHRVRSGTYGKEAQQADVKRVPTLAEFETRFMTYAENNNKPSTITVKGQHLRDHIIPAFGSWRLDAIRPADVEDFKAKLRRTLSQSRGRHPAPSKWAVKKRYGKPAGALCDKTCNNILGVLRSLLRLAADWEVIPKAPKVKPFKTGESPFDFLTFEEAGRLIAAADPEWRAAFLVAIKAGLRLGEIIGLQWSDLDLVQGKLNVRRTIWRGNIGTPKGGRARTVDLPASVVAELKRHRNLQVYVFCHEDGSPFTEGEMGTPLSKALRLSGISREEGRIGWHDLRHTYGSHLAMRGVSLKAIQEQMGHSDIKMTLRYAHLSPESKQAAVQVLDDPAPRGTYATHEPGALAK